MTTPIRDAFLQGMSRAAQTVNIVTTDGPAGRAGVTVSAMASVSADAPAPTLLVCVHHLSQSASRIIANGVFCVNVLRDDQTFIADTFAGRFKDRVADKFDVTDWIAMPSGAPRVVDPLVAFDCKVSQQSRIGTHHVFMGEVQDIFVAPHGTPLIYAHRAYGSPTRIDARQSLSADRTPSHRLSIASVPALGPHILPALVREMAEAGPLNLALIEGEQRRVQESLRAGEAELAVLYDLNLPGDLDTLPLVTLPAQVLLAATHPLATRTILKPQDLDPHSMELQNPPPLSDHHLALLHVAGVTPRIAYRSTSPEMVRAMVGQGLGYTLVAAPAMSLPSADGHPLVTVPLTTPIPPIRAVLAFRRGASLSPLAQRFTSLARAHFVPTPKESP